MSIEVGEINYKGYRYPTCMRNVQTLLIAIFFSTNYAIVLVGDDEYETGDTLDPVNINDADIWSQVNVVIDNE